MPVNINCIYNCDVAFCSNKKIKKSLFGLGARCCIDYPFDKVCVLKVKYEKPPLVMTRKRIKMNSKKITIEISNTDLDRMEDYFTVDFERNFEEEERCRKIVQKIWQRLVEAWEKK